MLILKKFANQKINQGSKAQVRKETYDRLERPQPPGARFGTNQMKEHHGKPRKTQHGEEYQGYPSFGGTICA
jgi:hypothetical protein